MQANQCSASHQTCCILASRAILFLMFLFGNEFMGKLLATATDDGFSSGDSGACGLSSMIQDLNLREIMFLFIFDIL
jgi:hypothetical protein